MPETPIPSVSDRAYYSASLRDFCSEEPDRIFARLARRNDFDLTGTQRDAWIAQARILQAALAGHSGALYLEFTVPRIGSRADALVIIGPVLFVLEFKVGDPTRAAGFYDGTFEYLRRAGMRLL